MEEIQYLTFIEDDSFREIVFENQDTELHIGVEDYCVYLNAVQFQQLKDWILKQEIKS